MSKQSSVRAPRGLDAGGRKLWREVAKELGDLGATQQSLLLEAARCQDRLDALDASIRETGVLVEGSMGQQIVNSALTEARGQQTTQYRLLATVRQLAPNVRKPQGGARGAYSRSSVSDAAPRVSMESALDRARRGA